MVVYSAQTDESALALLGKRLAAFRVRNNWTQAELAKISGVGKGTVERIERGESVQVVNLIKVLRACGYLDAFLALLPDDSPSPMQLLRMGSFKPRRRARNSGKKIEGVVSDNVASYSAVDGNARSSKTTWVWDEDK